LTQTNSWRARRRRFLHRVHARRAAVAEITTTFKTPPEPRIIGQIVRGQQLINGHFLFSGLNIESPDKAIWTIAANNPDVMDELQGCGWLDDLAAVGDKEASARAQTWVFDWINRFGDGEDAGWTPGITGRRLIRWINHAEFVLRGADKGQEATFMQSLARQTLFLSRRWQVTPPGIRQFEAIIGTIYAGLSLEYMESQVKPAVDALAATCTRHIDDNGAIPTRNPEELLEILTLLTLIWQVLSDKGEIIPAAILDAVERIAPTLRALRHSDGSLARFHGGGRGVDGRLDAALAASGNKMVAAPGLHMGYARMNGGRTSVIVDASAPPSGAASLNAHASTLSFELTSGRRQLIVNSGSGRRFGTDWRRASRATPSHSTMMLDGVSSSHLSAPDRLITQDDLLSELPTQVYCALDEQAGLRELDMSHNGYQPSHGLTHARILQLTVDGRSLHGDDVLAAVTDKDQAIFDKVSPKGDAPGLPFSLRFHLHPDVMAVVDADTTRVTLALKSGEVWELRNQSDLQMTLMPSVYLENGRLKPLASQQVVLSGRAMSYATRVRWSLAKTDSTPDVVRDLEKVTTARTDEMLWGLT